MFFDANYPNMFAYRFNPNNFEGDEKTMVEKHNNNLNVTIPSNKSNITPHTELGSPNITPYTELGSPNSSVSSSGVCVEHSYFDNDKIISSCIG